MTEPQRTTELRSIDSLAAVDGAAWDAVRESDYPFTRHAFLNALERSGATTRKTGWQPQHLLVERGGELIGHLPLYLKYHSYGEYVFDWSWADAYRRHGLAYYPKLLSAIPYTPATGPRLELAPSCDRDSVWDAVAQTLRGDAQTQASSLHILFPASAESERWDDMGLAERVAPQYHWFNAGYRDFDDYLSTFTSRKRKDLRKERRRVAEQEVSLRCVEGADIDELLWQRFYACYQLTYAKRSGHGGYLNEAFFREIGRTMPEQLLMVVAERDGRFVAAALNFRDSETLYGRYWGCVEEVDFLHFEACYYQGIDYCIRHGLKRFDPGAQGEHKIQRGFEPVLTRSRHWIVDEQFRAAIDRFLVQEADAVRHYIDDARRLLPFRAEKARADTSG